MWVVKNDCGDERMWERSVCLFFLMMGGVFGGVLVLSSWFGCGERVSICRG